MNDYDLDGGRQVPANSSSSLSSYRPHPSFSPTSRLASVPHLASFASTSAYHLIIFEPYRLRPVYPRSFPHAYVATLAASSIPSSADHRTFPIWKELASGLRVPSSRLLSQSLEAPKPHRFPLLPSRPPESFWHGLVTVWPAPYRPIVVIEPSIVAMMPPVVGRAGCAFPSSPKSAEHPFRPQLNGTQASEIVGLALSSVSLPYPLLLLHSALSSCPYSSTRVCFDIPPRHRIPHTHEYYDVVITMSAKLAPSLIAPLDRSRSPSSPAREPDESTVLRIKRHSELAHIPTRGSAMAAGYDLYNAEPATIPARGQTLVNTKISVATPKGTYGHIAPRSGLASKFSLHVGGGVINSDYRGTIRVLLFNLSDLDFEIGIGDQVAQLVLECVATPNISEVPELDSLSDISTSPISGPTTDVPSFVASTATLQPTSASFWPSDGAANRHL